MTLFAFKRASVCTHGRFCLPHMGVALKGGKDVYMGLSHVKQK